MKIPKRIAGGIAFTIEVMNKVSISVPAICALIMTVIITMNVILRYVFNSPLRFEYELVQVMLLTFLWLGQAYIFSKERSITVDVVVSHLSVKVQTILKIIGCILGILYFAIITKSGLDLAMQSFEFGSRSQYISRFPLGPQQLIVPIGAGCLCLQLLVMIRCYIFSLTSARNRESGKGSHQLTLT